MRLVSQDAFAAARGEAFVATADNPSAIVYNPAGLTQLEGHNLRAGATALFYNPTFQPPDGRPNAGQTYRIENDFALAPQLYYTYSWAKAPVSAGIGIYAPYGGAIEWPQDTGFRTVGTKGSLTCLRLNPVVAAEVAPGLSVAGGLMVDYAKYGTEQGLRTTTQPFANVFSFTGWGWGFGFNVGLLAQLHEKLSFGATFRSGTTVNFKGDTQMEQQPVIQPVEIPASVRYEFPLTAVFGFSWRPTPQWNLEVNMDYTDWSSFDTVTLRQEQPPPFPVRQDITVDLYWKASWMYGAGVTRYFNRGWHASLGYLFNQNSVPDTYYSPLIADLDRHFVSVGFGRKGSRLDFDLTYQFGYGPPRTVSGSTPPSRPAAFAGQNADGTYDWISHALLVSVAWGF